MKTLFLWIRYLAINGAFAALVWLTLFVAPFNQNYHLASVLVFLTVSLSAVSWVYLPIAFIVAIVPRDEKLKYELPKKISVVPGWFDILFDLAITIAFIYAGWIWVGIIYCSHIIPGRISVACLQHAADKQNKP
jgi:hypothetical protein